MVLRTSPRTRRTSKALASKILLDTGIFVALANARDAHHTWATTELARLRDVVLITCEAVLAEALFIIRSRMGYAAPFDLVVSSLSPVVLPAYGPQVLRLIRTYPDRMDFADACLVYLAGTDAESKVFTVDRQDFSIYRTLDGRVVPTIMPPYNT